MSSVEELVQLSKEVFNIFNSKVTDIITTVANTPMEVKMGDVEPGNVFDSSILEEKIEIEINLSGFFDGTFYYVMEKSAVARLADLMMMGDGSAEYEPDHCEAVSELFNQIIGAFITDASAQYGSSISNAGISASETKFEDSTVNPENMSFITGTIVMDGFDDFDYYIIFDNVFLEKSLENISSQVGEAEDLMDEIDDSSQSSFDDVLSQFDFDSEGSNNSAEMENFDEDEIDKAEKDLQNIYDISLDVSIELGKTRMSIRKILGLSPGSIVELDKLAGEPVDILVNQKPIAKGEVVVIDESFGVRLTSLISPEDRIKSMG